MNRTRLKNYAPKARLEFIRAVTDRARKIGLTASGSEPVTVSGDVAFILGQEFPRVVAEQRRRLDERIERQGFGAVMEEVAYTWFNRFMAIRYMELHGYLDHGFRVLSHPEGKERPEILDQAEHVELPGLDRTAVIELKLDGTQDELLYKTLLLAQCHALHAAMPFLFEKIDDQTELLLPNNLLASDSIIRKMVTGIAEEDWEEIEVIGWLYQFYISDKKDEVIGKVVKSEDIPAATQLFTPNWIVKYMVQNSLGRKWLATYPYSPLKTKMEYYIEPAEQTPEVQAQFDAITPTELNPEELTLIDPACGSGHILCQAYDLFKEIYLERGYRLRDIPRLVLEKNLFGLDIDDRAAQMAGFALLMKALADDRRILENAPHLNVLALHSSVGLNAQEITDVLLAEETYNQAPTNQLIPEMRRQSTSTGQTTHNVNGGDIRGLLDLFVHAKAFGSLLNVPHTLASRLPYLHATIAFYRNSLDLLKQNAVAALEPLVLEADLLARRYDISVTNPPYMGSGNMNSDLKHYAAKNYPNSKADTFAMFIERGFSFAKENGNSALVTMHSWMFISSYEDLRKYVLNSKTLNTMAHLGSRAFSEIKGEVVQVTSCVFSNGATQKNKPVFIRAVDGGEEAKAATIKSGFNQFRDVFQSDFAHIPGAPIAYWAHPYVFQIFANADSLGDRAVKGLDTNGNIELFVKRWFEVSLDRFRPHNPNSDAWYPIAKGGEFRRWYGNHDFVIKYSQDGYSLKQHGANLRSLKRYFTEGLNWTVVSTSGFAVRYMPPGFLFDQGGSAIFADPDDEYSLLQLLGNLNSNVVRQISELLCPTLNFTTGDVRKFPLCKVTGIEQIVRECVELAKTDWDSFEISWDFRNHFLLDGSPSVHASWQNWELCSQSRRLQMQRLEEKNNCFIIEAYGLHDIVSPDISTKQVTLACADREKDIHSLISYSVGCLMGRYSLDRPGMMYAHSGNHGFDASHYKNFPADDDGILPITDADWFGSQEATGRFSEFVCTGWPLETFTENLKFMADSLGSQAGEAPNETIRRYFCTQFYKSHLQTYKRRPIYWLFTSGKERAFQALVYLHRYNEGTLARMRMDYVVPLQSRMSARIDQLRADIAASVTTADRKKREKERAKLLRQLDELRIFDEKLRHYADMRISLDLDDGVKVNYGKFGDLLAEVKIVTGGGDE